MVGNDALIGDQADAPAPPGVGILHCIRARPQACNGFNLVAEYDCSLATMLLCLRQHGAFLLLEVIFRRAGAKNDLQSGLRKSSMRRIQSAIAQRAPESATFQDTAGALDRDAVI
jgi:hypothetical protein